MLDRDSYAAYTTVAGTKISLAPAGYAFVQTVRSPPTSLVHSRVELDAVVCSEVLVALAFCLYYLQAQRICSKDWTALYLLGKYIFLATSKIWPLVRRDGFAHLSTGCI